MGSGVLYPLSRFTFQLFPGVSKIFEYGHAKHRSFVFCPADFAPSCVRRKKLLKELITLIYCQLPEEKTPSKLGRVDRAPPNGYL